MKKIPVLIAILAVITVFSYCHSAKKAMAGAAPVADVTFNSGVKELFVTKCAPCHIPEKGGHKEAYDNYDNAKKDIDDIIRRVEMTPEMHGFMPRSQPRLSDSSIALLKKWKQDGLKEN